MMRLRRLSGAIGAGEAACPDSAPHRSNPQIQGTGKELHVSRIIVVVIVDKRDIVTAGDRQTQIATGTLPPSQTGDNANTLIRADCIPEVRFRIWCRIIVHDDEFERSPRLGVQKLVYRVPDTV
jgi:hypothetical protein